MGTLVLVIVLATVLGTALGFMYNSAWNELHHNTQQCCLLLCEVVARVDHLVIRLQEWDMSTSLRTHNCVFKKTFTFNLRNLTRTF